MKKMLSVIFVLAFLIGSVSLAGAATLVWSNGDPAPVAGYIVAWGPTQQSPSSTSNSGPILSSSCISGADYDCSFPIPTGLVGTGETVWLTVKAFNMDGNGQPCANDSCSSQWAAPISYTNGGSGNTGKVPGAPTGVKLKP